MITAKTIPWIELSAEEIKYYRSYTSENSTYKSPFYQYSFINTIAQVKSYVFVLILSKGNIPFAFLPFQYHSAADKLVGLAERIGSNMSDFFGPIIKPDSKISSDEIMEFASFNLLNFDHLPSLDLQFNAMQESNALASQIIVNGSAEGYFEWLKAYNKKFYSDTLRRRRKAIEALGPLRFTFDNKNPVELTRLISKKRDQYSRTRVKDSLSEVWKIDLLEALSKVQDESFEAVVSTLYCGETWLASHLGLKANGILQYWLPVYATEYRNYAPGRLLLFANIESLENNELSIIDRGEGLSDAKKDTANYLYHMGKGSLEKSTLQTLFSKVLQKYRWKKSS